MWDDKILPGADWSNSLRQSFQGAKCVVALLSNRSLSSPWIRLYLDLALARGTLVLVKLETIAPETLPLGFEPAENYDLSTWRLTRDREILEPLLRRVASLVGRQPGRYEVRRDAFRAQKVSAPGTSRKGYDLFLSHKSEDKPLVEDYVRIFGDYQFSVWWDALIPAGANWGFAIDRALAQSRCFVVFWTSRSVLSEEVYTEAEYGIKKGAYFPILLEACEIPPRMSRAQWVDLTIGEPLGNEKFHKLLDQLGKRVAGQ
jgi:TIR domain-containing protein